MLKYDKHDSSLLNYGREGAHGYYRFVLNAIDDKNVDTKFLHTEGKQSEGANKSLNRIVNSFSTSDINKYAMKNGFEQQFASVCLGFFDYMGNQRYVDGRNESAKKISQKIKNQFEKKKKSMDIPLKLHPISKKIKNPITNEEIYTKDGHKDYNDNIERFFNFIGGQNLPKSEIPKKELMNLRKEAISFGMFTVGHPSLQQNVARMCTTLFKDINKMKDEEIKEKKLTSLSKIAKLVESATESSYLPFV